MADKKVSGLTAATTPLAGSEELHIVQGGNSRKVDTSAFYLPGGTDVAVTDGGTGASSASAARTNLGLGIGSDVQAYDAGLTSIAGLTTSADNLIYTTASDTYATTSLTSFARTLLDDGDAATARGTLGVEIGSDVQAYDALLASIAGLTTTSGDLIYTSASDTAAALSVGTEGQVLKVSSGGLPEWGTVAGTGDMVAATYDPQGIEADAFDRTNHTGTQDASTITGLATVATTGSYDDLSDKPAIADQTEAETGTDNTTIMTPLRTAQSIAIHRNYWDAVRDFDMEAGTADDQRTKLVFGFQDIAASNRKRLYIPKGVYRLSFDNLTSLVPPQGLEIFGDGPDDTILEVSCNVAATRTPFGIVNSDIVFHPSLTVRVNKAATAQGAIYQLFSLGNNASNLTLHCGIDGQVEFLNAAPDNTLRHTVFIIQRRNEPFSGIYVDNCHWRDYARAYIHDHNYTSSVTRRVRFGSKVLMERMYRENIAVNAPNVLSEDWEFLGGTSNANLDREYPGSHMAVGNSKKTRIIGWNFNGAGTPIHVEESAVDLTISGCVANLISPTGKFARFFANDVSSIPGAPHSPTNVTITGNTAYNVNGKSGASRGIDWGNTGVGPAMNRGTITGNIMVNFERGYDFSGAPTGVLVNGNIAADCVTGYLIQTGASAALKALQKNNHALNCSNPYVDVGGGAVPWGSDNTSS